MKTVSGRDGAFLAEMGIAPLWTLRHVAAVDDASVAVVETVAAPTVIAPAPAPVPALVPAVADADADADADIARMDWPALREAINNCTRCGACRPGAAPVHGAGAGRATWFVAAGAVGVAEEQANLPVAGDAGKLLDNMLAAAGHARARDVFVTHLVKCRPVTANGGDRAPSADEIAACRPFVARELALTGAGVLLTVGQVAANAMLGKPLHESLAGSRGQVHAVGDVALVATLHPAELLRRGADKALAWADLCRAMALPAVLPPASGAAGAAGA
ncbi:MAG: uracil-DNA glycosylase [Pseudomonadota bacterium]|nr:uracil-DNA glycosylase [Pseudomonadota bacterium]